MVSIKHIGSEADLVRSLQRRVDLSPYQPNPTAPQWLHALAEFATGDGGVLAVLGPGGIRTGTYDATMRQWRKERATPDASSVLLAGLADRVRESGEKFAVGVPPAARHLPLLLAATAVMDDTLASQAGAVQLSHRGVLVLSPDLDLRSRYCDLFVGDDLRLDDVKPGARMKPSGERVMLRPGHRGMTGRDAEGGVCFFLPFLELPSQIDYQPAVVVLDLRFGRWVRRAASLAAWVSEACIGAGVIALYSTGDHDTFRALVDAEFADLPFDHEAISVSTSAMGRPIESSTGSLDWALHRAEQFLDRSHQVESIRDAADLETSFGAVGAALDEHRQLDDLAMHRARWLLAAMMQLPAPVDYYERAAAESGRARAGRMIDRLSASRAWEGTGNADAIVQSVRVELRRAYQQLTQFNPRSAMLQRVLPQIVKSAGDDRVLVLVRDRTMERATRTWLLLSAFPHEPWLDQVDVVACPDYSRVAHVRYAAAIVNGAMPRRYRWITGAALGRQVIYLAYAHEHDVIERQINEVYSPSSRQPRAAQRTAAICGDTADATSPGHVEQALPALRLALAERPVLTSPSRPSFAPRSMPPLTDIAEMPEFAPPPTSFAEGISVEDFDEDPPGDSTDLLVDDPAIDRIRGQRLLVESRLRGSGSLWLPADGTVEVVRPSEGVDVMRVEVTDIRDGDVVICLDADGRVGLFDRMAALASEQPEMTYLSTVRRLWVEALDSLVSQFSSAANTVDWTAMLNELRRSEPRFRVTSEATLRNWARDEVIGPEDQYSVVAVGKVVGSSRVVALAPQLNQAFRRIRGIRQGIGRRLTGLIRRAFADAATGGGRDDNDLDDHLLLPLDELLESVDLAQVIAIAETSDVPPAWLRRWRP